MLLKFWSTFEDLSGDEYFDDSSGEQDSENWLYDVEPTGSASVADIELTEVYEMSLVAVAVSVRLSWCHISTK